MLHAGLDLSRRRLDVCVLSDDGELVARTAAPREHAEAYLAELETNERRYRPDLWG
jgi:hypothetical protein